MDTVRIVIADDHQLLREGIRSLLRSEKRFQFVGEAKNAAEAKDLIIRNEVDVLITDINMPGTSGIELTQWVKLRYPEVKVLVLTMYKERSVIREIFKAQAEGYILKNTGKDELIQAIGRITDNGTYYSQEVLHQMLFNERDKARSQTDARQVLTPREIEVVRLISEEYSTATIAEKLFLSPRTVDTHRKNILEKTGAKTIVGLMRYVFDNNLLEQGA